MTYSLRESHSKQSLVELNKKYNSDKGDKHHSFNGQSYLDIYDKYFFNLKDVECNVLEIGVKQGKSLRLWRDYFVKGNIFGVDFNPECKKQESERISICIASQDNKEELERFSKKAGGFDIIIDDGSHIVDLTLKSFSILFPYLKSGGIYVFEDLATTYKNLNDFLGRWDGELKRNKKNGVNLNHTRNDMDRFLLDKIKEMDVATGSIMSIHFWSKLCFIFKV